MKVLICDDDVSTVDVILNHIPWDDLEVDHVLHAYNGLEAKKIISAEKPEIIVSDIGMPLCNGIEVLKYIREIGLKSEFIFLPSGSGHGGVVCSDGGRTEKESG